MRVIFAGGGTGGHINPAVSIADYAKTKDKDFKALFIGTEKGLEKKLIPALGYNIEYIDVQGFDRSHILSNIKTVAKLFKSVRQCRRVIKDFKPDCIVCTGGYVSGPVAIAAHKESVPSLIHEQNVFPGLTVKGSGKYVDYIALSFDETVNEIKEKTKCVVTGNPVRESIINADYEKSRKKLGINEPFVLIFGGSLGAARINNTVIDMLQRVSAENRFKLVFGTGDRNYDEVMQTIADKGIKLGENVTVTAYIDNMADMMAAADLVVSRSGAITVSEIAALSKPSVLIPSPNVVRNHQEQNAREFAENGAAEMILESALTPEILYSKITEIISDKRRMEKMSNNLKKLAKTDALENLYGLMLRMSAK